MAGPFKLRSGNTPLFKQMGSSPAHTHTTGVPHSESGWKPGDGTSKNKVVKTKTTNGKKKKMQAYEGAQYYTHPTKNNEGFATMQVSSGSGESDADRYVIQYKPGEGNKAYKEFQEKNPNIKLDERKSYIQQGADKVSEIFNDIGSMLSPTKHKTWKMNPDTGKNEQTYNHTHGPKGEIRGMGLKKVEEKEKKRWNVPKKKSDKKAPTKHRIGKHPAKDGHVRADHPKRRQDKKDAKLVKKAYNKDGTVKISRNEDIKTVRGGGKSGDKTVKDSKKIRDAQNRINIDAGSKVRHTRKTILGIPVGKYKRTSL